MDDANARTFHDVPRRWAPHPALVVLCAVLGLAWLIHVDHPDRIDLVDDRLVAEAGSKEGFGGVFHLFHPADLTWPVFLLTSTVKVNGSRNMTCGLGQKITSQYS